MEDRHPQRGPSDCGGEEVGLPTRTCVVCGRKASQHSLLRIRRGEDGGLAVGGMQGRSAYVCATGECVEKFGATDRVSRTLRTKLGEDERRAIQLELRCKLR